MPMQSRLIPNIRGRGLFYAMDVNPRSHVDGNDFAQLLAGRKILSKATHRYTMRFAPPLTIDEKQLLAATRRIKYAYNDLRDLNNQRRKEKKNTETLTADPKAKRMLRQSE